jgi:immune inhibitor A
MEETMRVKQPSQWLLDLERIYQRAQESDTGDRCVVAPSPELSEKIKSELARRRKSLKAVPGALLTVRQATPPGFNDGLIYPGSVFPLGTPLSVVRNAAASRTPLSGVVRVIVVLVSFTDEPMTATKQHYEELFFSTGVMPNGSVRVFPGSPPRGDRYPGGSGWSLYPAANPGDLCP